MLVTAKRDGGKYKVFFEGTDISRICAQANDTEGWADVLILLSENEYLANESIPIKARIRGKISIVEKPMAQNATNEFMVLRPQ